MFAAALTLALVANPAHALTPPAGWTSTGPHRAVRDVNNPALGEIRYVPLDDDGCELQEEVVNKLQTKPLRIEHFMRDRETRERVHWAAPRSDTMRAIETTVAMAKAKAIQECDPTFVGAKA